MQVTVPARPVVLNSIEELERHTEAWTRLAAQAEDPNPFYEPWFMLPLLRVTGPRQGLCVLMVYGAGQDDLLGFFPFERTWFHRRIPIPCLRSWRDSLHWVLRGTPLIRKGAAETCIAVLLDWLATAPGLPWVADLTNLPATTVFSSHLAKGLSGAGGLRHASLERWSHLYSRQSSFDAYRAAVVTGGHWRSLKRRARRLAEIGPVRHVDLDDAGEGERLIHEFLSLEAAGWKGDAGTAMVHTAGQTAADMLIEAWRRGRLSLLGIRVAGRLVAARSVFLAPPGGFEFKVAHDQGEAFARCSPGYLVELEGVRRLHDDDGPLGAGMAWLDTCATIDDPVASAFGSHILAIRRTVIARRGTPATLLAALLPRLWKRRAQPHIRPAWSPLDGA